MIPAYDSRMKEKSEKNWEKLAKMSIYRYISNISIHKRYIDYNNEGNQRLEQTRVSLGSFFHFYLYIGNYRRYINNYR